MDRMPQLTWLGDADARRASRRIPYRILDPIEIVGDSKADNLLIQGDNLAALKALLPFYAGRVKCIFIDPPYNTKSAFEHYDDNLEHSQWLSMMYPRFDLLRDLLSDDGAFGSRMDDNEAHYLKTIGDEILADKTSSLTSRGRSAIAHRMTHALPVFTTISLFGGRLGPLQARRPWLRNRSISCLPVQTRRTVYQRVPGTQ